MLAVIAPEWLPGRLRSTRLSAGLSGFGYRAMVPAATLGCDSAGLQQRFARSAPVRYEQRARLAICNKAVTPAHRLDTDSTHEHRNVCTGWVRAP